jgi:hypothetical protein
MDDSPMIPIVKKHDSALETGLNAGNLEISAAERHPVDVLQRSGEAAMGNPYQDLNLIRSMFGSGVAMEMAAERKMARNENAMGLSKIGGLYGDIVLGNDASLQLTDYMALPENRAELPKSVFHVSMERQLKNL